MAGKGVEGPDFLGKGGALAGGLAMGATVGRSLGRSVGGGILDSTLVKNAGIWEKWQGPGSNRIQQAASRAAYRLGERRGVMSRNSSGDYWGTWRRRGEKIDKEP